VSFSFFICKTFHLLSLQTKKTTPLYTGLLKIIVYYTPYATPLWYRNQTLFFFLLKIFDTRCFVPSTIIAVKPIPKRAPFPAILPPLTTPFPVNLAPLAVCFPKNLALITAFSLANLAL